MSVICHLCSSSSLLFSAVPHPPFVIPGMHCSLAVHHPCFPYLPFAISALHHPCYSLLPFIIPGVCCSLAVHDSCHLLSLLSIVVHDVVSHDPMISTSITPYKQWRAGRAVVLCDVAPVLVQEKDLLPPCKQRLTAVAWGAWCGMSFSLLSRGNNL